jgi:hypothetical protein
MRKVDHMGNTWKNILTWLCIIAAVVLIIAIIFLLIFPTNPEYRRFRKALEKLQSQETLCYTVYSPDKMLDRQSNAYTKDATEPGKEFLADKEGYFSPRNMVCQTDGENTICQFEVDNGANNCTGSRSTTKYTFTIDQEDNIIKLVITDTYYSGYEADPEKVRDVSRYVYLFD